MKKLLALACGVSAFALISNANAANTSSTVEVSGTITKVCFITPDNRYIGWAQMNADGAPMRGR